ncbi:MAG TPA: amidase family protein [Ilumatobacter sp.]|nr:amidase family protein [Ilumatobacter sp.]
MTDFRGVSAREVAGLVQSGASSAREQAERALAAIAATNDVIHAFVAVDAERALAEADAVDRRIAAGDEVGPLAGVPIGVKDLEDAVGYVTTRGSALHRDDAPATGDSPLVERLRAAGCVVVGKTNTPEYGWQADTSNEIFPTTVNPWNPARSAGGSSGGSGAALAAGMVPLATGSDGGGSIRIPSALNGLSGLKPSRGRVPLGGPEASAWLHYSTSGPMAARVADIALALDASVGPDPTDLSSLPMPRGESWAAAVEDPGLPKSVIWSPNLGYGTNDTEIDTVCRAAVERLAAAGVEVIEVDVFAGDPVLAWAGLAFTGLLRKFDPYAGTPAWDTITPGLRKVIELAAGFGPFAVYDALAEAHRLNFRLVELFHQAPLLLCPTVAGQTGLAGEQGTIDGEPTLSWVSYTPPFNMTGNPAGSVCAGFTADGMPVGLQVVGPQHADIAVLRAIAAFEQALDVDTVAPLPWR